MTKLFEQIESVLKALDGWGWCTPEKAYGLAAAIWTLRPAVVVEVGIFAGRSIFPMALACKAVGTGRVIGIDPWVPQASVQGQVHPGDKDFWAKCDHERVYLKFLETRSKFDLNSTIEVHRMISDYYDPPNVIDMWHCDGNHSLQALRDAQRFGPKIRIGGMAFMDDVSWSGGGVGEAVKYMRSIGFVDIYKQDDGMMMQRTSH